MDAAIYGRRVRGGRQFVAVLALVAACYALGGASGFVLKSIVAAGSATNAHAIAPAVSKFDVKLKAGERATIAPAVSKFDVTLKAGERQALQQDQYGPWSDLTRALPKGGQVISSTDSVVYRMDDMAPGFIEQTPGMSEAAAGNSLGWKFHEPGTRLGGGRI